MTIFINFLTVLAMLWSALMAVCVVVAMLDDESSGAGAAFIFGIPAWAWLIARYCL